MAGAAQSTGAGGSTPTADTVILPELEVEVQTAPGDGPTGNDTVRVYHRGMSAVAAAIPDLEIWLFRYKKKRRHRDNGVPNVLTRRHWAHPSNQNGAALSVPAGCSAYRGRNDDQLGVPTTGRDSEWVPPLTAYTRLTIMDTSTIELWYQVTTAPFTYPFATSGGNPRPGWNSTKTKSARYAVAWAMPGQTACERVIGPMSRTFHLSPMPVTGDSTQSRRIQAMLSAGDPYR